MVGKQDNNGTLETIQLQNLINSLDDLYYFLSPDGKLQKWNDSLPEVTGYTNEKLAGMDALEFFGEEDAEKVTEAITTTVSEQRKVCIEADLKTKAGDTIPYEFTGNPTTEDTGEVIGITGVGRVLTERKQRTQQLRQFREAVEHAGHAVYITDPDGTIEYVNPAFENITGYEADKALGETPDILNSGEHDEAFYETLWETITTGESWNGVLVDEAATGEKIILNHTITPLTDDGGNVEKFVAIAQDISKLKDREQTLEDQRDNLEVLNKVVRHDIRNNLQLVLGYAESLKYNVGPEGEEQMEKILDSAREAVDITTSAREITEVLLKSETDLCPVDLRVVVRDQIDEIQSSNDSVVVNTDTIPDVKVRADDMLNSVFRNLVQNAITHTDKDLAKVTVSGATTEEIVRISIADNGPGIPDNQKDEIFEEGTTALDSDGTGLGLYLVDTLVDRYNGTVSVEDNEPEGSVFTVELPYL